MSGRHEWHKRVKARERYTKRRTDTIGACDEGCKVARGECKACRKTKAGLVKEGCRGQRKQPIGTSGSHTWGTQSKSEIGATRIRRWVDTEGARLRGRQEKDAPSAGQTRLARAQRAAS